MWNTVHSKNLFANGSVWSKITLITYFVKSIYSPLPEAFINWEEIEYSDHDRKQKKGKEAKVVDPDLFLQMVMLHHNFDTMQAYLCYAKVGTGTYHCEIRYYLPIIIS